MCQCFATLKFCQGIARLKYAYQKNRHSNNLTCMLRSTLFLDQKSLACKFFISIIQTLNLSLHCTYPKLSCSMKVNKEKLLIHILQGTNNTDDMYPVSQTALHVYVIRMWQERVKIHLVKGGSLRFENEKKDSRNRCSQNDCDRIRTTSLLTTSPTL